MAQIFTTSQHVPRVCETSSSSFTKFVFLDSLAREEGEALCSFLEIERSDPVCRRKCSDYGYLWINFSLKMQFQNVLREKSPNFSHKTFCLSFVAEMFLEMRTFTLLMISYSQIYLCFSLRLFFIHMTPRILICYQSEK